MNRTSKFPKPLSGSCLFGLLALVCITLLTSNSQAVDWEDQSIFRINKEAAHATKMPFADSKSALAKQRLESSYSQLLNGDWKYNWVGTPDQRPVDFYKQDFDDSTWGTIPVPSNVELEGHGVPIYSNSEYPFKRDAPRVMGEPRKSWTGHKDRNPVSSYRKTFTVDKSWDGRQTFVVFNGVQSAFYLWCNGKKVGYSQDSRTPAEFNLTSYLQEGENTLAVEVYRFSDGSYLEDQDFWRLSGIFRDVYLWSAASIDLRDFEIHASLDGNYDKGTLSVKTWTKNYAGTTDAYSVEAKLLDGDTELATLDLSGETKADADDIVEVSTDGLSIDQWSAEKPRLYDLLLTLKDASGETAAVYSRKVGFRTSEIKNGQLLVNGQAVFIKGVNRHDHHHVTGHYISEEAMLEDLDQMKRLNINAIRTSHYPNDSRFLELCDEYGFYVVSEANIETHGYSRSNNPLPKDMSWYDAHLDRISNNVEMHKNHACAVIWSLGNEAGDGPVFTKCLEWVHNRDSSRPVQYENAHVSHYRPSTPVDIFAPMYHHIRHVKSYIEEEMKKASEDRRPLIQCEYSHAMGNSCGGLKEYWDLVRSEPMYQGGFIWDWRDQGILRTKPAADGQPAKDYFAFGGDFGDHPNANNFCMNGVVGADTTPNSHAYEVFHQYRNLLVSAKDVTSASNVVLNVTNELFFTNIEGASYQWQLLKNGEEVANGTGKLPSIEPQATAEVSIDTGITAETDAEYILTFEQTQGVDMPWGKADRVVACEQVILPWGQPEVAAYSTDKAVELKEEENTVLISGDNFSATVDSSTGQLTSYVVNGKELLKGALRMNFWRAPIDNDRGNSMPKRLAVWKNAADEAKVTGSSAAAKGSKATLTYDYSLPAGKSTAQVSYTIHGDGVIDVTMTLNAARKQANIPRIGMQCQIARSSDNFSWYGRGPWENYNDRNSGSPIGIHSGKVTDLSKPYSETQEFGNRTDVRWASFLGDSNAGLRIESTDGQNLEIGSYPYAEADLEGEHRTVDLVERDYLTVHIAHAQMGVGGEDSWGARTQRKYSLRSGKEYKYSYRLLPVKKKTDSGVTKQANSDGFDPLISPADFDGEKFTGWTKRGGNASYHVEGDAIVGTSTLNTPNTFLSSDKLYGDFILEYEIKIDGGLNSGVQIRSLCKDKSYEAEVPDNEGGTRQIRIKANRVHGYQVEIDPSKRSWSGGIYDEARRGWLYNLEGDENAAARAAFKPSEWNQYRIEANGDHLQTWINGVPVADLKDGVTAEGFIALQVHAIYGEKDNNKQIRWRNLRIKSLD